MFSRLLVAVLCSGTLLLGGVQTPSVPKPQETLMHHAHGTFTVKMGTPTPGPAEGLNRFSMQKEIHGSIEGTSKGEMIAGGDYKLGSAGYVAIELVTGTLDGRKGSFALQQTGAMDAGKLDLDVIVTPGSGSGDLQGITGTFRITIKDGQHFYDLDYTLPEGKW